MTDLQRIDLTNQLRDDVLKIKLLIGDLTENYLSMGPKTLELPKFEWNEFIKKLGIEYYRYSIIAELVSDNIFKIEDQVN
ncbi:MAG: hypothetical protein KJ779_11120, partial [Firmicutes bacterium]|nr:hypothetical protein [Bacillota bacterium]